MPIEKHLKYSKEKVQFHLVCMQSFLFFKYQFTRYKRAAERDQRQENKIKNPNISL